MIKAADRDRKARLDEVRRQQKAAERRRVTLLAVATGAVVVLLATVVILVIRSSLAGRDPAKIGVAASAAACQPPTTDKSSGVAEHVGPGTNSPGVTRVKYPTVPPSSGEHFATPDYPTRGFYTAADRPAMETLVHNLEHGYTIVWYAADLPKTQIDELRKLRPILAGEEQTNGKLIVSAWDTAYGAFPAGVKLGMSHWSAKAGHRELCAQVSGAAIRDFTRKFPASDAPEPNAQ